MTYLFTCPEPGGMKVRVVTEVAQTPQTILPLYRKLATWNKGLGPEAIGQFYDTTKKFWSVDDVGLLWSTWHGEAGLEGHFVFWDGRLRGREGLVRSMAAIAMSLAKVKRLWVIVPQDKKMILNFLWRVGFSIDFEYRGLCKVYMNHPSWRD